MGIERREVRYERWDVCSASKHFQNLTSHLSIPTSNRRVDMKRFTGVFAILLALIIGFGFTVPLYAQGVIYDTENIDGNKIRITLKRSNPEEKKGIRISYFNIKNGKTIRIGYEETDAGPAFASVDFDMVELLPPVRINLIPAGVQDYSAFSDIKGIEAEEYITHLHDAGIVKGREGNSFIPYDKITRAEFATLVVKALKLETASTNGGKFIDVDGHWARDILLVASEKGLISGYEDGTLRPDNSITVSEACTLIERAFKFKTVNNGYYSRLKQNAWYSGYVKQIFDSGILRVTDSIYKNFDEEAFITRADCAMMISRALSTY